ncbi:MAG TPA: hypothetical protein VNJ01_12420 [Bacteriovoracaceae bacterium]|nr:hypothetical protein [Bacteriovoracaceae bacterium]
MRLSFKLIIGLWIGLFLIISALLYNAYSKLRPETFVAIITEQIQKNYPGSKLEVGKVDYKFSIDFNLNLKNIRLLRSEKVMGSIGEIELIVPWWLLLTKTGNAQVNVSDLIIYVDPETRKKESILDPLKLARSDGSIKVALPDYLSSAKFTLRAKNVSVRDSKDSRNYFTLSKLLVREFQYGKNSAFELHVPVEITHKKIQYESELWLFGDVTPDPKVWKLNYRGDFRTREVSERFQVDDLVIDGKTTFKPSLLDLDSRIDLLIDKEHVGAGVVVANENKLSIVLNFTKIPLNFFSLLYEEINNPYLKELKGEAAGLLKFEKSFVTEQASVAGKLSFPGSFKLSEQDTIPGDWQINFQDARWEISFRSPKGEASFLRKAFMDLKSSTITQYTDETHFKGLDLDLTIAVAPELQTVRTSPEAPQFISTITYENCLQADKILDGEIKYGVSPEQRFYKAELTEKANSFTLSYSTKNSLNSLDASFKNFSWAPSFRMLEPFFNAKNAILTGKVEGRWAENWDGGEWVTKASALELREASGAFPGLFQKLWEQFEIDSRSAPSQNWDIVVKNKIIRLNSVVLGGADTLRLTGSLSDNPKHNSSLSLTNQKTKNAPPLLKNVVNVFWLSKDNQ